MDHQKLIARTGTSIVGTLGVVDATSDRVQVDCEDLTNINAVVKQNTDAGTATLTLEKTYDGTTWVAFGAAYTEASFAAGDGAAVERALESAAGMPLHCKAIRLTGTAVAGGGAYSLQVSGLQRRGYKS